MDDKEAAERRRGRRRKIKIWMEFNAPRQSRDNPPKPKAHFADASFPPPIDVGRALPASCSKYVKKSLTAPNRAGRIPWRVALSRVLASPSAEAVLSSSPWRPMLVKAVKLGCRRTATASSMVVGLFPCAHSAKTRSSDGGALESRHLSTPSQLPRNHHQLGIKT